jgi:excinuclease ABC subunit C
MKNGKGKVVYVGKAKNLSSRVKSYLQKDNALDSKTRVLMRTVDSIDYIATDSEVEALVLECSLIKEHRPRYNIKLKDDKRYPFIKLTNERFPRLRLVRRVENDGADYFGPYTDVKAVRRTLRAMHKVFPLRDCIGKSFKNGKARECLNFQIGRCLGPCTGRVSEQEYAEIVENVRLFLKGRNNELQVSLERRMRKLAGEKKYEEAAVVRDQIASFGRMAERQLAVAAGGDDEDVVALAREDGNACGVVMKIREGRILGSESFFIPVSRAAEDEKIFDAFLELYYHTATDIPPRIYVQTPVGEKELVQAWLRQKTGRKVVIVCPRRGDKKGLVELASKNASLKILSEISVPAKRHAILADLKQALGLRSTPFRIEAFDISNIQGSESVGAMVTFENGAPLKSGYRHFKIRDVHGIDDYAMLAEVIRRRVKHLKTGKATSPDLILIDGGKGQLSSVRKVLNESDLTGIAVIGLAKKHEEIHMETRSEALRLPKRSPALRFLQQVRDEAHRFAVEYHRKLRMKRTIRSELDGIEGIGEKRKLTLLVEFGSLDGLKRASVEDISSVPGIGDTIARRIYNELHR